jgi:hypothetical protein
MKVILLALSLCLYSLQSKAFAQIPDMPTQALPTKAAAPTRAMHAALTAICTSKQLEDAGLKSGKMITFTRQASKLGAASRADLEWIIENGSPAGRLYAAALLRRLDNSAGSEAFKILSRDMGDVNIDFVGTNERCHYSISDVIVDQNSLHPLIQILPKDI